MMVLVALLVIYLGCIGSLVSGAHLRGNISGGTRHPRRNSAHCQPFKTQFSAASVSQYGDAPFVAISPKDSYETTGNSLNMYLRRPKGSIKTHGGVNNIVADGATINSTFTLQYAKVTFEVEAPAIAGVVTAVILIADQHDEIDVELLGGDRQHWQTNVYAPQPQDKQPLWGVFGKVHKIGGTHDITGTHRYTIDWTKDEITWSIDDHVVRVLTAGQTYINGTSHFPTHPSRIQLGIWDASNPVGTSEWAKGPIDWNNAPETVTAVIKSVVVECSQA